MAGCQFADLRQTDGNRPADDIHQLQQLLRRRQIQRSELRMVSFRRNRGAHLPARTGQFKPLSEKIYWKTINWRGVDMEYYLSKTWYHPGPSLYQTEPEIEDLLAYWDQKLREVAWIDTYDDVETYIDRHMIYQDSPEEASKHGFNTGILPRRLVIAYLRGQRDLAALADEWLYKKNYASINKQITIDNLAKTVPYLEKLCGQ